MIDYVLGEVGDFEEGKGRAFDAGGRILAVILSNGKFYAFSNRCPHKGASMCDGEISMDGNSIRCPWHNWLFSLESGVSHLDPSERIRTFEVSVEGKEVVLRV